VRKGRADFALVVDPPVLMLCYRLGDGIHWSDAPFSWHRVPADQRALPPDTEPVQRALLHAVLIDANNGIIRAMRAMSLSPSFTAALHRAIRAQAAIPWEPRAYDATLALLQRRTSAELAEGAEVKCRGGE
jgi:hypothetical protein